MAQSNEKKTDWYLSSFEAFEKGLNGLATAQVHEVRKAALARFAELGFPTTRSEEWKYTDISPLTRLQFKPVLEYNGDGLGVGDVDRLTFGKQRWNRVTFVNGHFSKELSSLSLPFGISVAGLAASLRNDAGGVMPHLTRHSRFDDDAFAALNTAFLRDGVVVRIPDNIVLDEPIHVVFVSSKGNAEFVTHPRNLFIVGKHTQAKIIETYVSVSDNVYFTNAVTEIVLGENSVLHHQKVQLESEKAFHVGAVHAHLEHSSNYISNSVSFGGILVRNNVSVILGGEGAEATLDGLYVGTGTQVVDNHTAIDHAMPHCSSHELYKGILDSRSKGVFNGKIIVRKDAQKTDAKQTNKNLILSDDATVDTKPQLEILANDVRCTHGATIGQLDDDAIFYLRARGISLERARDMLIDAFASDVIDRIGVEAIRTRLLSVLRGRLEQGRASTAGN